MDVVLYILIFCMGTVFGSFFTLAVHRIPLKQNITHERSYCPNCNHKLGFWDMIPILSYLFLRGKCKYCKQKIRPRYLMLEILSGAVFVLFALSLNISIENMKIGTLVYFVLGLLYIAALFIIAGIDKEKKQIEKSVLLYGYIVEILYIMYLYIVEHDANIYRYVIYLSLLCLFVIIDALILRKKAQYSYLVGILMLSMLFIIYTFEAVYILTMSMTLFVIGCTLVFKKIKEVRRKTVKKDKQEKQKLPIGFYMCTSNIICLIITNFYIFYVS